MPEFGKIESTLFVPMLGRLYASEQFPDILYDEKALGLKEKLPAGLLEQDRQGQYPLIASASRSANMDRCIRDFLGRNPRGAIVQLGVGLETAFYRNDNGHTRWYGVDVPDVIAYRRELLPEPEREAYLAADAFADGWIRRVRADWAEPPLLVTAGGLFHYFPEERILGLLRMLQSYGRIEMVFDAVSQRGLARMRKKYMKQVGHAEAEMFFHVDSAQALAARVGGDVRVLAEEPYYRHIPRRGLKASTKLSMDVSDRLGMVKMIRLALGESGRKDDA